jgi:hypothetical protein
MWTYCICFTKCIFPIEGYKRDVGDRKKDVNSFLGVGRALLAV